MRQGHASFILAAAARSAKRRCGGQHHASSNGRQNEDHTSSSVQNGALKFLRLYSGMALVVKLMFFLKMFENKIYIF